MCNSTSTSYVLYTFSRVVGEKERRRRRRLYIEFYCRFHFQHRVSFSLLFSHVLMKCLHSWREPLIWSNIWWEFHAQISFNKSIKWMSKGLWFIFTIILDDPFCLQPLITGRESYVFTKRISSWWWKRLERVGKHTHTSHNIKAVLSWKEMSLRLNVSSLSKDSWVWGLKILLLFQIWKIKRSFSEFSSEEVRNW